MKVLLDVGANMGQTARPALDAKYGFDKVISFEPAPPCWPELEAIKDPRFQLCKFGLWNKTCQHTIHDPGSQGASIYNDLEYPGRGSKTMSIDLVKASDWMAKNISSGDTVFMKLNCEGSEVDIVEDLLESGELRKVYNLMIAFDVRRSATLRGREAPLRARLRAQNYQNVAFSEDVMRGVTHQDRIDHWLALVGAHERLPLEELRRKYAPILTQLSQKSGRLARLEQSLRDHVLAHLPAPLQNLSRTVWGRIMRGHREGPA